MNGEPIRSVLSWNNFTGGHSGDKHYGAPNTYYDAYNIDTTEYNAKVKGTNELINTFTDDIESFAVISSTTDEIVGMTDTGDIFLYDGSTTAITDSVTNGINCPNNGFMIVGGVLFNYFFHHASPSASNLYVHKVTTGGILSTSLTYISNNGLTGIDRKMQVMSEGDRIIFSHYNNLYILDNTEIITLVKSFPAGEDIVGITSFQGEYKVYTNDRNVNSYMYKWNGGKGTALEISDGVDFRGLSINSVGNRGAYDFFVANGTLYKLGGVQYGPMLDNMDDTLILKTYDDSIYVTKKDISGKGQILKYGAKTGFKDGLHPVSYVDYTTTARVVETTGNFNYGVSGLYFASKNKLYLTRNDNVASTLTAQITSNIFIGNDIRDVKSMEVLFLKFKGTDIDNKIKLEAQINDNGTWITLFEGYNGLDTETNYGMRIMPNQFVGDIGNFNEIQFRVSFATDGETRPEFYGLSVFLNSDVGN